MPNTNEAKEAKLLPLDEALAPYRVSLRTGRALIKSGKLPASKPGREYLVDPADVARVLTPRLHTPEPNRKGETPRERELRQLRAAGVAV
jgi:excisionase family DNA binding protein